MTTITAASPGGSTKQEGALVRIAIGFTAWAERWFPDAFIFVAIAVVVVAVAAIANGASPMAVSIAFGNGFWSLITFTMQMAFVAIGGYVVATSAISMTWPKSSGFESQADVARPRGVGFGATAGLSIRAGVRPLMILSYEIIYDESPLWTSEST